MIYILKFFASGERSFCKICHIDIETKKITNTVEKKVIRLTVTILHILSTYKSLRCRV